MVGALRPLRQRDVVSLGDGGTPGQVAVLVIEVVLAPAVKCLFDIGLGDAPLGLVAIELIDGRIVVVAQFAEQRGNTTFIFYARVIDVCLVVDDVAGRGIVHGVERRFRRDIPVGVDVDRRLVGLALLGGDDDDTIGSQRAVDTGGGGILQHRHRLHIVGVDLVQGEVGGHVVDNEQRLGTHAVRESAHATQDGVALAGVGVDVHTQTSHLALQGRQKVFVHDAVELGGVDETEGGCRPFAAQALVTCRDNDGLGQLRRLLLHLHVDDKHVLDSHLIRLHAHIAKDEYGVLAVYLDAVVAVQVGHGVRLTALHADGHAI